jgi:hypothetical protein
MWSDGKVGGKIALKPGNFGMRRFCMEPIIFSGFGDKALRNILSIIR